LLVLLIVLCVPCFTAWAQQIPWSQRVVNSSPEKWLAAPFAPNAKQVWDYELAILLSGMGAAWYNTADASVAHGETVIVDAWFNSQQRQNAAGDKEYFHYKWNDNSDSGFSILGHIFSSHGASLNTLYQPPTVERLKDARVYIIVSPDNPAKNTHPHYVQPQDADEVVEWVKQGGVLVLMENDPANADITHLDLIADRFGIHFEGVLKHHVIGDQIAPGYIPVSGGGAPFQHSHTLYMKDTCAMSLKFPAKALLEDKAGIVMATAKYGKGTVFAVVDPWLYNEYTDHRKVIPRQDNYEAGKEFVSWLLKQAPSKDRAVSQSQMIQSTTTSRRAKKSR
jgi:unsaturated rhamnogalacturonyl hydrolase